MNDGSDKRLGHVAILLGYDEIKNISPYTDGIRSLLRSVQHVQYQHKIHFSLMFNPAFNIYFYDLGSCCTNLWIIGNNEETLGQ